jgi:hypothetical protein
MPRKPTGKPTGRPKKPVGPALINNATADPASVILTTPPAAPPSGTVEAVDHARQLMLTAASKSNPDKTRLVALQRNLDSMETALTRADKLNEEPTRAALKLAQADVLTLTGERDALIEKAAKQETRITQLETANAGLQAFHDAVHSEEVRIIGDKAETARLAELARVAEEKASEKAAAVAAFIVERDKREAEYERRMKTPYQSSAEDPDSTEDGASRQARIARENNEQMLINNACFDDFNQNWKGRTEPPPEWREPWADLHPSSMTPQQIAKREWVANNPKATDQEKRRVGILKPLLPPRRPGF